jgi:anaerobic selenocysteine-containing dehydrogenase
MVGMPAATARLIVIDPYKTRTAALADWYIRSGQNRHCTGFGNDAVSFAKAEDRTYIAAMTHGFEQLAQRVREYTPERVAA